MQYHTHNLHRCTSLQRPNSETDDYIFCQYSNCWRLRAKHLVANYRSASTQLRTLHYVCRVRHCRLPLLILFGMRYCLLTFQMMFVCITTPNRHRIRTCLDRRSSDNVLGVRSVPTRLPKRSNHNILYNYTIKCVYCRPKNNCGLRSLATVLSDDILYDSVVTIWQKETDALVT